MSKWKSLVDNTYKLKAKYNSKKGGGYFGGLNRLTTIDAILSTLKKITELDSAGYGSVHMQDTFTDEIKLSILRGAYLIELNKIKKTYRFFDYHASELACILEEGLGGQELIKHIEGACLVNYSYFNDDIYASYQQAFEKSNLNPSP